MLRLIRNFAAGIAKGLSSALRATAKTLLEVLEDVRDMLLSPISSAFGIGPTGIPPADFTPNVQPEALLDDLRQRSNRTAAIRELNRDGLRTVTQYLKAIPINRSSIDLSGLPKDVRATLITMSNLELRALADAGPGAVRKFIDRRDHGVHGVPVVRPVAAKTAATPDETAYDSLVRRIQAGLRDPRNKAFAMPKM